MSTLTATIAVQDDAPGVIAAMLRQFPAGSRVMVSIYEEEAPRPTPALEDYRQLMQEARGRLQACPWTTTAEAMRELREGEQD